jgi:hypothetical protein
VPVTLANNPNLNFDALKNFGPPEGINDNASTSYADPSLVDRVPPETIMTPVTAYGQGVDEETVATAVGKKEPSKFMKAVGNLGDSGMFEMGNMTKLIGNYLGMNAGLKNAAEQRSTDIAHKNEFANVGKESLKNINTAQSAIEGQKAAAIVKATSQNRAGKRGGRSSARGINQSRAMDWLYDTALNQTIAEITANAGKQSADLELQKSNVNMQSDIYKGEGAKYAALANERAKDAYYNAKGMGRKDLASGIQQTGKDLNAMKQNEMLTTLLQQFGKYVTVDKKGNIIKKVNK